jgi:hypothetical protein
MINGKSSKQCKGTYNGRFDKAHSLFVEDRNPAPHKSPTREYQDKPT